MPEKSDSSSGMDKTCKTCRWWDKVIVRALPPGIYKGCGCSVIRYVGRDDEDAQGRKISIPFQPDGACYWDFEEYDAGFASGPDFGCIHHETTDGNDSKTP